MVRLVVNKPEEDEEVLNLFEKEVFIGRNDPVAGIFNDVNLSDNTVSRRHARIFIENQAYFVEDLGSVNGIWVNDQQITKAQLTHGDRITIGLSTLVFESQLTKTINPLDYVVSDFQLDHRKTIDSNYFILQQLSKLLVGQDNLTEFLQAVMEMVMQSIKSSRGVLMLTDADGKPEKMVTGGRNVFYSEDVLKQVLKEKKSLLVGTDLEASRTMLTRGVQSAICAPLLKESQVLGAIYLEDPLPGRFGDEDLILLTLFANQVAAGLENVELNEIIHREAMIRSNLERFLSPRVAEMVTRDCMDKGEIYLKTERLTATVLFSDIKGFTLLSEKLDPQQIADLLSRYFNLMTEIIFNCEGTLDKYVGDGLVAIFGAPVSFPDHPARAVAAALQMLEEQQAVQRQTAARPEVRHPGGRQYGGGGGRIYGLLKEDGVYGAG